MIQYPCIIELIIFNKNHNDSCLISRELKAQMYFLFLKFFFNIHFTFNDYWHFYTNFIKIYIYYNYTLIKPL